jgi:hypothetical protein
MVSKAHHGRAVLGGKWSRECSMLSLGGTSSCTFADDGGTPYLDLHHTSIFASFVHIYTRHASRRHADTFTPISTRHRLLSTPSPGPAGDQMGIVLALWSCDRVRRFRLRTSSHCRGEKNRTNSDNFSVFHSEPFMCALVPSYSPLLSHRSHNPFHIEEMMLLQCRDSSVTSNRAMARDWDHCSCDK